MKKKLNIYDFIRFFRWFVTTKKKELRALCTNLAEAVSKIKSKTMSIRQAFCEYKIPSITLRATSIRNVKIL